MLWHLCVACFLLLGNSNSGKDVLELARLVQASNDITATDKFAANVELRDGRPVAEGFDALADVGILQNVHCLEVDACEVSASTAQGGRRAGEDFGEGEGGRGGHR